MALTSDNHFSRLTTNKIPHRVERRLGAQSSAILEGSGGWGLVVTDAQVRKLMEELSKHGEKEKAALKAGMDSKTARKYRRLGRLPSETKKPHTWRNRPDPFAEDWDYAKSMLEYAPELEAKALFEHLTELRPGIYQEGQVRTFQRRVRRWRAQEGPPKEVFFTQEHRPGEAMQTDFTWATKLGITIGGEPFPHMLCHPMLPYSNWEWATICFSESIAAIRRGVQAALFQLGRIPDNHQTDQSSSATHSIPSKKREFNADYLALMKHFGMTPRTIAAGKKEQNGDVESSNNVLKNRLEQHLILRGSRDFDTVEDYENWLWNVLEKANALRTERLGHELAVMRELKVKRLPEYTVKDALVRSTSIISVRSNLYSVPSRLIGETLKVRLYDDRLELYHGDVYQMTVERLHGRGGHRINYRHIIWSLVRKPGAFERYRYRDDLFPTLVFRRSYDALLAKLTVRKADIEYLRILHLAASTMESEVEVALELLLEAKTLPISEAVKSLVSNREPEIPKLQKFEVDLAEYDELLEQPAEVAS